MVDINSGKLLINTTYRYLYPALYYHSRELMYKLRSFYKVFIGIGDMYDNTPIGEYLYIVIDTTAKRARYQEDFAKFLEWLQDKDYYYKDYTYSETRHVVVLRMPDRFSEHIGKAIAGEFKGMYTKKELEEMYQESNMSLFNGTIQERVFPVILGNPKYLPTFVSEVNKRFATEVTEDDMRDAHSYEISLLLQENVLNLK